MSAYYYDSLETIAEKKRRLEINFTRHVDEILAYYGDTKEMEIKQRWTGRSPIQNIRREVVSLCNSARSWCYTSGKTVFGGEASKHAKAMRACLIVEMNIWRAALRKLTNKSGN